MAGRRFGDEKANDRVETFVFYKIIGAIAYNLRVGVLTRLVGFIIKCVSFQFPPCRLTHAHIAGARPLLGHFRLKTGFVNIATPTASVPRHHERLVSRPIACPSGEGRDGESMDAIDRTPITDRCQVPVFGSGRVFLRQSRLASLLFKTFKMSLFSFLSAGTRRRSETSPFRTVSQ